jgi:hypothetical protein
MDECGKPSHLALHIRAAALLGAYPFLWIDELSRPSAPYVQPWGRLVCPCSLAQPQQRGYLYSQLAQLPPAPLV